MSAPPTAADIKDFIEREEETELRELVNAHLLFNENYRRTHAGTGWAPQIESASAKVRQKLLEL